MITIQSVLKLQDDQPIKEVGSIFGIDREMGAKAGGSMEKGIFPDFIDQLKEEGRNFSFKPEFVRRVADRIDGTFPDENIATRVALFNIAMESFAETVSRLTQPSLEEMLGAILGGRPKEGKTASDAPSDAPVSAD